MRLLTTAILTILGFAWGFLSTAMIFIGSFGGSEVTPNPLIVSIRIILFLPGYLGFISSDLIDKLLNLNGSYSVLGLLFAILYGILILLLVKEAVIKIKNRKN